MVKSLCAEEILIDDVFRDIFHFPPVLTIDVWADQNRVLSTKEAAISGKWKTSRTPYLREIMQCLSPSHPCQRVVLMKGTQIGGTEVLVNWNGYTIDQAPCPCMNIFPGLSLAADFSKQRLASAIENSECLKRKVNPPRKRDSGNTILVKEFQGGIIFIVAGNSEIGLISRPIKNLGIDEADQYPGYTIPRAEERTVTFEPHCKIYIASTPRKALDSIIANEYKLSDQRKYNIACPECNTYQTLVFKNIKFKRDDSYNLDSDVTYACEGCGDHIPEHKMKADMENRAKWVPQNQENGLYPGFHLSQLYSTLGSATWTRAVEKFLRFTKQKKDKIPTYIELQEAWTNDVLAEAWEEKVGESVKWEILFNRREDYDANRINENILTICAGVDVHGDRIEIQTIGVGLNFQIWVLEYKYIYGKIEDPEIWAHLDQFLLKSYRHPCGKMRILGTAVDTGYHPDDVYQFVKTRCIPGERYVLGIKGSSLYNQPIVATQSKRKDTNLFGIDTNTTKDKLSLFLQVAEPGPGYIHFPLTLPEKYFTQLCAEKKIMEWDKKKQKQRYVWRNPGRARNEPWDTLVYAIAALNILQFVCYPDNSTTEMLELFAKQMKRAGEAETSKRGRMISEGVEI